MKLRCLVLGLTFALMATTGSARTDIPCVDQILFAPAGEATILIVPDGSGPPLSAASDGQGGVADATISVRLVSFYGGGAVFQYPYDDIWLQFNVDHETPGTISACNVHPSYPGASFVADSNTDLDGWTTFTLPLRGGGWSVGPCWVYLAGNPAYDTFSVPYPPLPLRTVSPDINGDLTVDLLDVVLLGADFHSGYNLRSDLHCDGVLNLLDLVVLGQHLGAACD
jgi:hypothetical protein